MKINWQMPLMDAAIAVAGGSLLKGWVGGFEFVANLMKNVPAVAGIDLQLVIYGAVALIVAKNWIMK